MLLIDNLFIAVIVISIAVGAWRGFFPEALSLLTWVAAVWLAWTYSGVLEEHLVARIESPVLTLWIARFVLFAAVLIVGGLLNELVSLLIEKSGLTGTDRILGMVFGFARGLVIIGVIVIFAQMLGFEQETWWGEANLVPMAEGVAEWMRSMLPPDVTEFLVPESLPVPAETPT